MQFSSLFRYFLFIGPIFLQYTKYVFFLQAYVTYSGSSFYSFVELIQQLLKNTHYLSYFWTEQLSQDPPADAGFVCDKAAVFGESLN
jgi:hypothetical protein